MILDESTWSSHARHTADVVIIGAGAAGITLALELESEKKDVILVEGGREVFDNESQECYRGKVTARDLPYGLLHSRMRFFGGSTNCWAGGCGELDDEDFIFRPWVNASGWPFSKSTMAPWYEKAAIFLGIDAEKTKHPEDVDGIPSFKGFDTRILEFTKKTRFNSEFGLKIKNSKRIRVFYGSNFYDINRTFENDTVESIEVVTFGGKKITLYAKTYVLSCGGVENARLLLNTKGDRKHAIGDLHNNLGRYFSDHPIAPCATVIGRLGELKEFFLDTRKFVPNIKGERTTPFYRLPYALQEKFKTLNVAIQFSSQEEELDVGELSAWKIRQNISKSDYSLIEYKDIKNVLTNLPSLFRSVYSRSTNSGRIALRFQLEQAPDATNRITLSSDYDSVGLKRSVLHWNFSKLERHSLDVAVAYTAKCLQEANIGTLRLDRQLINNSLELPYDLRGGQHHCGTTRMSSSPKTGVVDKNLKVFNSDNLYILGSSVFPSNGWVNPTFTIIALSLRLSNHLKNII